MSTEITRSMCLNIFHFFLASSKKVNLCRVFEELNKVVLDFSKSRGGWFEVVGSLLKRTLLSFRNKPSLTVAK